MKVRVYIGGARPVKMHLEEVSSHRSKYTKSTESEVGTALGEKSMHYAKWHGYVYCTHMIQGMSRSYFTTGIIMTNEDLSQIFGGVSREKISNQADSGSNSKPKEKRESECSSCSFFKFLILDLPKQPCRSMSMALAVAYPGRPLCGRCSQSRSRCRRDQKSKPAERSPAALTLPWQNVSKKPFMPINHVQRRKPDRWNGWIG